MADYLISLISSYLTPSMLDFWLYPFFTLAFVATVPSLIWQFFRRG